MRWIPLFAVTVALAVVSSGAEYGDPATVQAADATAPATDAAPSTEEQPQLDGVVLPRPNGGFLTLTMDEKKLVVKFYDEKKKPVAADVRGGFVRFRFGNRSPERRPLVISEDGMSLTHGEPLRPPYVFKAYVTLRQEGPEDADVLASEEYVTDFP